jgi:predicted amidophosphoribosyltransferase
MPNNEEYKFYKERGICVLCRKELAAIGRVSCPECLDKQKERSKKQWIENKDKLKLQRKRYDDLHIAFGICVRCHKK